jgi:hypothetical protein
MEYFQNKNPDLGKFRSALQWKMLVYYLAIWSILRLFGIFCGHWYILRSFGKCILWPFGSFYGHLVHFSSFGVLYQEKSGNPGPTIWGTNAK